MHDDVEEAIKMWEGIRDEAVPKGINIAEYKKGWCRAKGIKWDEDCWLCEHYQCIWYEHPLRPTCPLESCSFPGSPFQIAYGYDFEAKKPYSMGERIAACEKIIEVLRHEAGKQDIPSPVK